MGLPIRSSRNLKMNKDIYIYTEGTETEEHYFNALKQVLKTRTIKVVVKGVGNSGVKLISYAASCTKNKNNVEVWVVFDKDDLRETDISDSKKIARRHDINIAFSNCNFEVWLLLHFEKLYYPSGFDKRMAYSKLGKHLGVKDYEKNKSNVMLLRSIADKYITAVKNNEELLKQSSSFSNAPFTNMIDLINSIKK